jgi:flagellar protein FliO/FliZ
VLLRFVQWRSTAGAVGVILTALFPAHASAEPLSSLASSAESSVDGKTSVEVLSVPNFMPGDFLVPLLLGLMLIVGLIVLLAWLLKRLGGTGLVAGRGVMRVVATLSLGTRERAVLVQVGEQQLLLGVAQGRVTLLHAFDQAAVPLAVDVGAESSFSQRLVEALQRGGRG